VTSTVEPAAPAPAPTAVPELARSSMSPLEVLAQSVSGIAPSAVVATGPLLLAAYAGSGTWVSYVIASAIVLIVGYCIVQFATRTSASGSLYTYTAQGLGGAPAFLAGIGLIIGYAFIAMGALAGAGIYAAALMVSIGVDLSSPAGQVLIYLALALVAVWFTVRGAQLSTRIGLVLEVASILAIVAVLGVALANADSVVDSTQLTLDGSPFNGITYGVVLAVLGFVGFEGAASLGAEAKNPKRAIPRAVLLSAAVSGLLYVVGSYVTIVGFGGVENLLKSAAPMNDLANSAGLSWLSHVIDVGVVASFLACVIGSKNAAARILFAMGREGLLTGHLGKAHQIHFTPHLALYALAPAVITIPSVMVLSGTEPIMVLAYLGTIGTFGYMTAYLLVSIAMPVFLSKRGEFRPYHLIAPVVAVAALLFVVYKNLLPVPPAPLDLLPRIYLVLLVLAGLWYAVVAVRWPHRAKAAGTMTEDALVDA
jgi:amino acid transporter